MKQNGMVTNGLQSKICCLEYAARIAESLILNTLCVLHWKKNNVSTNWALIFVSRIEVEWKFDL